MFSQLNVVGKGGLPPYTYAWTPTSALDDPTIGSPLTGPETTTTYSVTVTDATGATRQASATVWVSDMGLGADAQPREIVVGESSQLNATVSGGTPPYSFSWAPAAGLSDSTIANPVASPAVTTTYTVTATDALGVSPQASATVTVYGLRVIPSASPTTVNPGQPAQLSVSVEDGTPPFSFDWHQLAAPSFNWERLPSADHALPDPTVSPSLTTQYRADVTDSRGLFGRGVVIVRVPLLVNPSATPSSINPGDSTQLAANVSGGGPFLTGYGCTWSPAAGLTSVSLCEQLASPAATTVYTVTARDLFGAMATGQVTVTVNTVDPPPTAAFIFTRDVSTFTIHLDGSGSTGNIVSYGWDLSWTAASPDAVTASPMTTFPFVEGTRGTITLTVTAADGRTASVTRRFP